MRVVVILSIIFLNTITAADWSLNDQLKECFSGSVYTKDPVELYQQVSYLLSKGANPNISIYGGESILFNLIVVDGVRHEALIDLLLQHPQTDVNKGNRRNYTPLMASQYYPRIFKKIVQHPKVFVNAYHFEFYGFDMTALDYAIERENIEFVEMLLAAGALPKEPNRIGITPLERATRMREKCKNQNEKFRLTNIVVMLRSYPDYVCKPIGPQDLPKPYFEKRKVYL